MNCFFLFPLKQDCFITPKTNGQFRLVLFWVLAICSFSNLSAMLGHGPVSTMYTDVNYRRVKNKRIAEYRVDYNIAKDTVFFETHHLRPEGLIEKGYFPRVYGFDVRNCTIMQLWPDGKIKAKGQRVASFPDGAWDYFDQNGVLYSRVHYSNGLMHGYAYRYYSNGDVLEIPYENGKRLGESLRRDKKNRILFRTSWYGEYKDGWSLEYDTLGHIIGKTLFKNDHVQQDSMFYPSGKLSSTESYDSAGNYHGRCLQLTEQGKILRFDEFDHGQVIQNECRHPIFQTNWNNGDCYPMKTQPRYPGGEAKYEKLVRMHQDYPELAREWKVQAVVEYVLYLDSTGKVLRFEESNLLPVGYNIENEVIKLLKMIPRFEPLTINGIPRPSRKEMLFAFIL